MINPKSVFVFDLDDTLYPERDYLLSGVAAVLSCLQEIYGVQGSLSAEPLIQRHPRNWLDRICREAGLNDATKNALLWVYRLHRPDIQLNSDVRWLLERLSHRGDVAILTDGRSITQRQKLKALQLEHFPVYISEEYGSEKPDPLRFQQIMTDFPGESYYYIGDNPSKDFLAPNGLAQWVTVGIKSKANQIHSYDLAAIQDEYLPDHWIDNLLEIEVILQTQPQS